MPGFPCLAACAGGMRDDSKLCHTVCGHGRDERSPRKEGKVGTHPERKEKRALTPKGRKSGHSPRKEGEAGTYPDFRSRWATLRECR